jgi:acetyl-CoA acetyltransferase
MYFDDHRSPMKHMREAVIAGVVRTPFVKPGSSFRGIPEAEVARLVIAELLFSSSFDPSHIDTILIASCLPLDQTMPLELSSSCRALGFDRHFRVISLCSGSISDLAALNEAYMRISTGESDGAIVIGVGVGDVRGAEPLPPGEREILRYPGSQVNERYSSTFENRRSYTTETVRKAREARAAGRNKGMTPLPVPPFFEYILDRDDIFEPHDTEYRGELDPVMLCDVTADRREGLAALILTTAERVQNLEDDAGCRISCCRHLGVPDHLRGIGAAIALESLLAENQLSLYDMDVLEIGEMTAAQVLSSLAYLRVHSPQGGPIGEPEGRAGETLQINPTGGSLGYGFVPAVSGITMFAAMRENLAREHRGRGAICSEDFHGQAHACIVERICGADD